MASLATKKRAYPSEYECPSLERVATAVASECVCWCHRSGSGVIEVLDVIGTWSAWWSGHSAVITLQTKGFVGVGTAESGFRTTSIVFTSPRFGLIAWRLFERDRCGFERGFDVSLPGDRATFPTPHWLAFLIDFDGFWRWPASHHTLAFFEAFPSTSDLCELPSINWCSILIRFRRIKQKVLKNKQLGHGR